MRQMCRAVCLCACQGVLQPVTALYSYRSHVHCTVCGTSVFVLPLQVDGHYTQEALKAEEREVVLRQRLAQLEEEVQRTARADMTNRFTVHTVSCS